MDIKNKLASWKYSFFLLFGVGISNIGEWIYFLALNLIVLKMTGSPLAVTVLYIMKPLAVLVTNVWAGSLIDRMNKRSIMVFIDLSRAVLILSLTFFSSLGIIYIIVFLVNMASAVFQPASLTYITKLIPKEQRKRFNSFHSLITSGAFLIGPAVAGLLFMVGTPALAIFINAVALFLSGLVTLLMPNLESNPESLPEENRVSVTLLKSDWRIVKQFSRQYKYVVTVYFLFSWVMVVMATGVDSLEAAFAKEVLHLTDGEYGFLVSIAGAGIAAGAVVNAVFVKKLPTSLLIGAGSLMVSAGYIIYAFSEIFPMAAAGFFLLAFFIAFANTGFLTFSQDNIPVELMGRVTSVYGFAEAGMTIIVTVGIGITAETAGVQAAVIAGVLTMTIFAVLICVVNLIAAKRGTAHAEAVRVKEI